MTLYLDVIDRRVGVSPAAAIGYTQTDFPVSFPYSRWTAQQMKYLNYWRWFTGEIWEETIKGAQDKSGAPVYKFPLKVNLIKSAAMKHNYVLFGEMPDTNESAVPIRVSAKVEDDLAPPEDSLKKMAKKMENSINDIWNENNGRILQVEGGLIQQFLGGIAYKLTWDPFNEDLEYGIKVEMIIPDFFMPVWDTTDPDNLLEAFIVWRVPAREAYLKYKYQPVNSGGPSPEYLLYVEHWTKDTISISLGGQPLKYVVEMTDDNGTVTDSASVTYDGQPNPFGFIPIVYIPRERAGSYYGLSIIDDVMGLSKEINARMADVGDVIAESSHREVYIRNVTGTVRTRDIGGLRPVTDLGQSGPGQDEPDVLSIDPPTIPAGLTGYHEDLRKQYLRDAFISSVAEGEDEGSQRSALTLAFRMWPLTSKARSIRSYWTNAFIRLTKMMVKMAAYHKRGGLTVDMLRKVDIRCEWSPMVPRDREQLVNEMTLLLQEDSITPRSVLTILGSVPDPYQEVEELKQWMEYKADLQIKQDVMGAKIQVQSPTASTGLDNK